MDQVKSYRDLDVWQRAMTLVEVVYALADRLPTEEKYGLSSQIRRSVVSIPSNIAEGRRLGSKKEYLRFIRIAFGSGAELETQLEILHRIKLVEEDDVQAASTLLTEVMKMLNKMITTLSSPNS